jgi:hypothetical protein
VDPAKPNCFGSTVMNIVKLLFKYQFSLACDDVNQINQCLVGSLKNAGLKA